MISSRLRRIAEELYDCERADKYSEKSLTLDERDILDSEGLRVLSFGTARIVCAHPRDSSKVVKFARSPDQNSNNPEIADGKSQNKSEVTLWERASEREKNFLGEIHKYSDDNLIIVMERYEEPRNNVESGIVELKNFASGISGLPVSEVREENVAMSGNRYVLVDYGSYSM